MTDAINDQMSDDLGGAKPSTTPNALADAAAKPTKAKNKKIESLTPEQEAAIPEFRDRWIAIGLQTRKYDKTMVPELMARIYKEGGLEPPQHILHLTSPMAANALINLLQDNEDHPMKEADVSLTTVEGYGADGATSFDIRSMTVDDKTPDLRALCKDKTLDTVHNGAACYGAHDAAWLGFYEFWMEAGIEECKQLLPLMDAAKAAVGWFYPFEEACIVTPLPTELHRDDEGRLHNTEGAALIFDDGWGVWSVNGVRVPRKIIEEKDKITAQDILDEENAEIRRVMMEFLGTEKFIQESGARLVHKDDWGELYEKELEDDEPLCMVKVVNSTPEPDGHYKDYWIRVRPGCETAHDAVASTFHRTAETYDPSVET